MSKRKRYTATQKVEILREHLENHVPVSELCERNHIRDLCYALPTQIDIEPKKIYRCSSHNSVINSPES